MSIVLACNQLCYQKNQAHLTPRAEFACERFGQWREAGDVREERGAIRAVGQ
jgi:hypothetical protein